MIHTWQSYSKENGIELNDQYFFIRCNNKEETQEYMDFIRDKYGFKSILARSLSIPSIPGFYANLNTRLMFIGNVGLNILSGPIIGDHAISKENFTTILEIFEKYKS